MIIRNGVRAAVFVQRRNQRELWQAVFSQCILIIIPLSYENTRKTSGRTHTPTNPCHLPTTVAGGSSSRLHSHFQQPLIISWEAADWLLLSHSMLLFIDSSTISDGNVLSSNKEPRKFRSKKNCLMRFWESWRISTEEIH